ncbi:MAG: hypothetical protein ACYDCL_10710 [Myxococcales bacterium]
MSAGLPARRPEGCLSDLTLDRFRGGELAGSGHAARARAHLASCALCATRLDEIERQAAAFDWQGGLAALPQPAAPRARWAAAAGAALALLAAAAAFLVVPNLREAATRAKGGDALELIARHADGRVEEPLPEQALAAGDALRFRIEAARPAFLVLLDLDSRGGVTAVAPASGAARSIPAGRALLEGSYVLDDAPGPERFVALLCDAPVAVDAAIAAAKVALARAGGDPRRLGPIGLPCREASFPIEKRPP